MEKVAVIVVRDTGVVVGEYDEGPTPEGCVVRVAERRLGRLPVRLSLKTPNGPVRV